MNQTAEKSKARPAFEDRPILIMFTDDSTLFFAQRMRDCLKATHPDVPVRIAWLVGPAAPSYRQVSTVLPDGPDLIIQNGGLEKVILSGEYKAVLTSRVFRALGNALADPAVYLASDRACVVSFLGGLDFFPATGYDNRRDSDAIFVFPRKEVKRVQALSKSWNVTWQEVGFGHPSFLEPVSLAPDVLAERKDIYFFTQAISPMTKRGRMHMILSLAAIARANPDRTVWIKLRHLPSENKNHLHQEKYDYPALMAEVPDLPSNLKYTACTMDEALSQAALGITCTSTAAIDVVREGIPCMVHLDYVDNYMDPLVEPMRKLFKTSGLITSLDDMLHLRFQAPNPDWVEDMFCPRNLGSRVMEVIEAFRSRPYQVPYVDLS